MEEEKEVCREEEIFLQLRNLFTVNDYVLADRTVPSSAFLLFVAFFTFHVLFMNSKNVKRLVFTQPGLGLISVLVKLARERVFDRPSGAPLEVSLGNDVLKNRWRV